MGASSSKIEDDKALILCRERKQFVRQALDRRCSLAVAHVAYIQSLRNTGTALGRFVEPDVPVESSLYTTSTSATPEPLALTEKSNSQFSNSSPSFSQHVETSEPLSLTPSPLYSSQFHASHMKAARTSSTTVKERPPVAVTGTVQVSTPPKHSESLLDETFEAPPPPGTPPWDYFGLFHPIDNEFSIQEVKGLSHGMENSDDIRCLREEEGIPELEEEGEDASTTGGRDEDSMDSDDEFDQPPTESLVRMYKNRTEELDQPLTDSLPAVSSKGSISSETEHQNGEKPSVSNGLYETDGTSEVAPSKTTSSGVTLLRNGREKELPSESKVPVKDFFSCMKETEDLFLRASDSGREVLRMLEANKVQFRPLVAEEIAHKPTLSAYFTACFSCCTEEAPFPQAAPAPNEMKYLTWHRSASSRSSSSRNLGPTSKDDTDSLGNNLFSGICMNSGSHAATLDRLYAWERKLYDEVKASGIIRREYDMKCKLLRHQDSKGESQYKIDRTRASVKDLHSRIRVAIHRIDSISKTIEEIRDKELQPQLEELIGGLTRMWTMMFSYHKHQYDIMSAASSNGGTKLSSVHSESRRQATTLLQFELASLCSSFTKWITSQESYVQSINEWLLKCVILISVQHKSSRRRKQQFSPRRNIAPAIFVTCRDWLRLLEKLPTKEVTDAIKDLLEVTTHFLPHPEKGHRTRNAGGSYEELHRTDTMVDWSLNYDSLQSGMVVFLDRLKSFAEASMVNYEGLQKEISEARDAYERAGTRP